MQRVSTWLKIDEGRIGESLREAGFTGDNQAVIDQLADAIRGFLELRGFESQVDNFVARQIAQIAARGPRLNHRRAIITVEPIRQDDGWRARATVEGDGSGRAWLQTREAQPTLQRAELEGLLIGMRAVSADQIEAVVGSEYLAKAVNEDWPERWAKSGWTGRAGDPIKNSDIWEQIVEAKTAAARKQWSARTSGGKLPSETGAREGGPDRPVQRADASDQREPDAEQKPGEMRHQREPGRSG